MGTRAAGDQGTCWPAPLLCQAPTAEHELHWPPSPVSPFPHQLRRRGCLHISRAAGLALGRGSSASPSKVAPRAVEVEAGFCRQGFQTKRKPRNPHSYCNCWKEKNKRQNPLRFPKPVKRCSGSFHPLPSVQLALGWIWVVERKIGTLLKKIGISVFALLWHGKIWNPDRNVYVIFFPYKLAEKGFNTFSMLLLSIVEFLVLFNYSLCKHNLPFA